MRNVEWMLTQNQMEINYLQTKLFEAATQGSIGSLHQLLHEDPLILDRAVVNCFNETPLHVAAMLGHVEFVKEIIQLKPELVNEVNAQQASPLHVASSKGHVEVMKALLSVDGGAKACFDRDRNTLTPVHLAAAKGRVEAVKLLLEVRPAAARLSVNGGDNILHLCVKRYQLEVLKLLLEGVAESPEFINSEDANGNTLLHLAVADKQVETTKYLVSMGGVEVKAVNNEGLTAMDVLIGSRRDDVRDSEIKKFLEGCGSMESNKKKMKSPVQQNESWLEEQKQSLMIVAVLIATMAFQVGVNPPSGVWQQNMDVPTPPGRLFAPPPQRAGYSVLASNDITGYDLFYIANATSFMASLSIILLLVSGFPLRNRFFMWIMMVTTWIAITALALCYKIAIAVLTPNFKGEGETVSNVLVIVLVVWIILMALLLIAHTIRLIVKLVNLARQKNGSECGSNCDRVAHPHDSPPHRPHHSSDCQLVKKLVKLAGSWRRRLNGNNTIAI